MLSHLRERIATALARAQSATLATSGPAGLQALVVPCAASGTQVYLLIPRTSEHLLNLEHDSAAVVVTAEWQVRGRARVASAAECPTTLMRAPNAAWSEVVMVEPTRVSIAQPDGWGAAETIDLD